MLPKSKYNPLRIPSSVAIAEEHRIATTAGPPTQGGRNRCVCCLLQTQRIPLSVNFDMSSLSHLGYEYKELYQSIKLVGLILLSIFLGSGILQLQDTLKHSAQDAFSRNWSTLSLAYPSQKFWLYSSISFVSLAFFIVLFRMLQTYRQKSPNHSNLLGQQSWSLLLKNLPKSTNAQEKIRDLFKSNFDQINIHKIVLLPDMKTYTQAKQQILQEVACWKELLLNEQKKKQQILETLKKIQVSNRKLSVVKQQISQKKNQYFCGNALVVFEAKSSRQQVLKAWNSKFFTKNKLQASFGSLYDYDKAPITVEQAPSPTQINWQNICLPNEQYKAKCKLNYIILLFVQIAFFMVYFISHLCIGRKIGQKYQNNFGTVACLLLISVLCLSLLPWVISLIVNRQKQPTQTQSYQSLFNKMSLSFIIIKTLAILAVEGTFWSGPQLSQLVANKVTILAFCDLVISNLFWLINPSDIIQRIRKIKNKKNRLTQQQANNLFLKPDHNIPLKFSFLLSSFWLAIMFSQIAPIVLLLQICSIFCFFWIDKINLAKRSSVSHRKISTTVFIYSVVQLVELSLILKPLTNLILWSLAHQRVAIQETVMLIFGLVYNLIPKQKMTLKLFEILKISIKEQPHEMYQQSIMSTIYQIQSPITGSLQAKLNFIETNTKQKVQLNQINDISRSYEVDVTMKGQNDFSNIQKIVDPSPQQQFQHAQIEEKGVQQTQRNMFS